MPVARAVVDCGVYRDGHREPGRFTPAQALAAVRDTATGAAGDGAAGEGGGFVWLGLHEPDAGQMAEVAALFGLHPLAVEDAVVGHQRPKLERYDQTLVLGLRTVAYVEHDMHAVSEIVQTGEILIFCGPDFVVAVRHGAHSGLREVRAELETDPARLALGPAAVLHAITDHVVDAYLEVTAQVEADVEEMEEEVFTPRSRLTIEAIYQLKREVVELRRAITPLAVPLQALTKPDSGLGKEVRRYLRDVADHHATAAERVHDFDDALSALITASLARIAVRQNTDMRKISALVALAAVPTMIAGIYGMNFDHMPELRQPWGYPAVLILMVVACSWLALLFRRNGWL
ncbi:magnesium and cobalt transport protein CorA [Streptomyces gardneri]|nr:magnesium and cobalt transport protein CorA [Streptomyces gardneri]MBF6207142.1 magnesium and cobalt transport protein CorA [Streptomyces gardneri]UAK36004.1 magnesium and cobalt transport protein CorA [Nocardia asteroides]